MGNEPANYGYLLSCPVCGGKTRTKVMPDTTLINFPLFCPKCKHETLVNVKNKNISVIRSPKKTGAA